MEADDANQVRHLHDQLRQLQAERKEAIQGNFGYDSAVGDLDRQIGMVKVAIRDTENRSQNSVLLGRVGVGQRRVVLRDEETGESQVFVVTSGPSDVHGGCIVVNQDAAFGRVLEACSVGDVTDYGMVVSINGSPVLSKAERDEILRVRSEQAAERRRVAEEHAREAAEAAERRRALIAEAEAERRKEEAETAERWRILGAEAAEERRREAVEAAKRQRRNEAKAAQREAKAAEKRGIAEVVAAERDAERVKLAEEKAAARKARRRQWAAEKRERDRLEAQEQQLRRIAWLEDQRAKAESALPLSLEEARRQVSKLKALGGSAMLDGVAVSDRAEILYIRCRKRHDVASDTQRTADDGVTVVGGFVGFLIGALAGPLGAAVGAGVGAGLGRLQKVGSEKGDWAELLTTLKALAARPL